MAGGQSLPRETSEFRDDLRRAAIELGDSSRRLTARAFLLMAESAELRRDAASIRESSVQLRTELRTSVSTYATTMRQLGEPAEHVVIQVKAMADEAVEQIEPSLRFVDPSARSSLRGDMVRWSIDAYYGTDGDG